MTRERTLNPSHHVMMIQFKRLIPLLGFLFNRVNGFVIVAPMTHAGSNESTGLMSPLARKNCADETAASDTATDANRKRRLYSFTEARRIARGHGFSTIQEFLDYDCPGAYQLPKNPDVVWAEDWKGWNNFLGIIWDFESGRRVAREQLPPSINSKESYTEAFQQKLFNEDDDASLLPFRPDLYYKQEWQGWDDFLGNLKK